jgi:hypothetical protein
MKIAFLILAHKNPLQLKRLIRALDHEAFDFYIHLDAKVNIQPFREVLQAPNIFFVCKRVNVQWAAYSLVQAQLNGIEEIVETGRYRYLNVLSAQDFPLRSAEDIYRFFSEHDGTEFITTISYSPDNEWWQIALPRVQKFHFQNWRFKGKYRLQFLFNALTRPRRYPLDHEIAGNSQWFSITTDCARYLIDFLDNHPEVVRYFKYVWGADEFIFSTVVFNSPFRERAKDHLFYIDWSERKSSPKLLGPEDFEKLKESGKLFARKFDLDISDEIIKKLEAHIGLRQVAKEI